MIPGDHSRKEAALFSYSGQSRNPAGAQVRDSS